MAESIHHEWCHDEARQLIEEQEAMLWLSHCPYELPERLESLRNKSLEVVAASLTTDELRELVRRHESAKVLWREFIVLDTPTNRNGHAMENGLLLMPGERITLHQYENPAGELLELGYIQPATEKPVPLVAIRGFLHGRRWYTPGEAFETDETRARSLMSSRHAVRPEYYEAARIVPLIAVISLHHDGTAIPPGGCFEASASDATELCKLSRAILATDCVGNENSDGKAKIERTSGPLGSGPEKDSGKNSKPWNSAFADLADEYIEACIDAKTHLAFKPWLKHLGPAKHMKIGYKMSYILKAFSDNNDEWRPTHAEQLKSAGIALKDRTRKQTSHQRSARKKN